MARPGIVGKAAAKAALGGIVTGLWTLSGAARAWAGEGSPRPWRMGLQDAGSTIEARIDSFHNILLVVIAAVCLVVLALLAYVAVRFHRSRNPEPGTTTHNLKLEIIWTAVPTLIVLGLATISFPLLYYTDRMPPPDLTLKVTGHQWYWSYEYPDQGGIAFDSMAIWNAPDIKEDQAQAALKDAAARWLIHDAPKRMLEVDNRVVLPVGKVVRVQITAGDVLHSWFVPSLGINRMGVTGRLNEVWFRIPKEGIYYGQCSMICGTGHAFMPIVIEAVAPDRFDAWANAHKTSTAAH